MRRRRYWELVLLAFCLVPLVGCGGAERKALEQEGSNLKPLSIFYGQFIGQHRGKPPASEAEFKQFLQSMSPEQLASLQVKDVDSLFVSERDQKPYVFLFGEAAKNNPPGPAGSPVIAYEQLGVGGKRFVASSMGAVEEVDEARFRELVPGAPAP